VVLECEPPNYSTNFIAKKIQISFDEYIVLENVNQQLVVSPPMEEKPKVRLRKKTLIIQFEEELKDSTTYTFNFGTAIKDLHEGNQLLNYEYVFSTGNVLDSLSVKGNIAYAEDLSVPKEPILIMLYNDLRDSLPLTEIPLYVGRSDDSGVFSVNNLKADTFKIFALKDGNNNFLFDMPTEEIGFLDTSLIVNADFARSLLEAAFAADNSADSLLPAADSLLPAADSTVIAGDSATTNEPDYNSIYVDLLLFTEESEIQYITDAEREDPRLIQLCFARPLTDSFAYRFMDKESDMEVKRLEVFSAGRDTLVLWLKDSLDYKRDTLSMEVAYTVLDTVQNYVTRIDTLLLSYRERKTKLKKGETEEEEKLSISTIRKNGEQHLHKSLAMNFNFPVKELQDSLVHLFHIPDTVEVPQAFIFRMDSIQPTRAWMDVKWESASNYHLLLLPGAIQSMYGLENDTLDMPFRTRDVESYGQILLNLENVDSPVIIQLLNRDRVLLQRIITGSGLHTFSNLDPKDYRIKFIHDWNRNGKWDTGDYLEGRQPEAVEYYPKEITVRANWDHDINMVLEK
jgi:hypothetical protein